MIKLIELLFLGQIRGFGKVKINKYLNAVKESESLDQLVSTLLTESQLPEESLTSARNAAETIYNELMQQKDLKIITVFDPEYPQGFLSLDAKKPVVIYAKGNISILNRPGISVVGTRKPSLWTRKFGKNISKNMAIISGRVIVSGLAIGCDRYAHEGALAAGMPTVAVLPSGVNVITPNAHNELAMDIVEKGGCLVSEYLPNATAYRTTFVERDSLIAAMTDITYVIECAEMSGTMHTVDAAYRMGRHLACYYPNQEALERGAYEIDYIGNKKMIDEMGARVVSKQEELQIFFNSLLKSTNSNVISGDSIHQMVLSDYMNPFEDIADQ